VAIAQGKVEQRELAVQVIAQRAGRDLLRQEIVVVGTVAAAPVAVAAAAVVGEVRGLRCVVARAPVVVVGRDIARAAFLLVADATRPRERHLGRSLVFRFRAFDQCIFLQHPLDFRVQLDRR
jgi:hypothetical protein